jgi:hypothetical protein
MLGTVVAYGCLAAPVLLSVGLGGHSVDETTLFNAIGAPCLRCLVGVPPNLFSLTTSVFPCRRLAVHADNVSCVGRFSMECEVALIHPVVES